MCGEVNYTLPIRLSGQTELLNGVEVERQFSALLNCMSIPCWKSTFVILCGFIYIALKCIVMHISVK